MVASLLRFVLFAFVVYVAFLFVRISLGLKKPGRKVRTRPPGEVRGEMVKDEVCGTYIPRDEALTEIRDGVERCFCSEECRRKSRGR